MLDKAVLISLTPDVLKNWGGGGGGRPFNSISQLEQTLTWLELNGGRYQSFSVERLSDEKLWPGNYRTDIQCCQRIQEKQHRICKEVGSKITSVKNMVFWMALPELNWLSVLERSPKLRLDKFI